MWEQRIASYTTLSELAAAVNAPGNDVFDSHKVVAEAARMQTAVRAFNTQLVQFQNDLQSAESRATAAPLLQDFQTISTAMQEMKGEEELIFSDLNRGQPDKAGARMATMDHKYREVNRALSRLRGDVSTIQTNLLTQQESVADSMGTIQCGMVGLIFLMIGGAAIHGHRMARQMEVVARERERSVGELAVLEERNRLARDIHDTLAQNFIGIVTHLEAAHVVVAPTSNASNLIKTARELAREGINEARRSVHALRPQRLENGGLNVALDTLLQETPLRARLNIEGKMRALSPEMETNLLRIAQQALANVLHHAGATSVEVTLRFEPDNIELSVRDNGKGFVTGQTQRERRGFGLESMAERAASLGGRLVVESHPMRGTQVSAHIPCVVVEGRGEGA